MMTSAALAPITHHHRGDCLDAAWSGRVDGRHILRQTQWRAAGWRRNQVASAIHATRIVMITSAALAPITHHHGKRASGSGSGGGGGT